MLHKLSIIRIHSNPQLLSTNFSPITIATALPFIIIFKMKTNPTKPKGTKGTFKHNLSKKNDEETKDEESHDLLENYARKDNA